METVKTYTYDELVALGQANLGGGWESHANDYIKQMTSADAGTYAVVVKREGALVVVPFNKTTGKERLELKYLYIGTGRAVREANQNGLSTEAVSMDTYFRTFGATNHAPVNQSTHTEFGHDEGEGSYEKAAKSWGIPRTFAVASYAALFYLLYARSERGDPRAKQELDYFISQITPYILGYLDMTTGGEARYMSSMAEAYKHGTANKDVESEVMASKYITWADSKAVLHRKDGKAIDLSRNGGRPQAWMAWKEIRDELGMEALNWCIIAHLESPSGSYGGPLWSNAALLIRKYELGQISGTFLVDQAFSLQHNGGEIFNKMWDVTDLVHVLNTAFQGKTHNLHKYLKLPEHIAMYRKVCGEATPFDLRQQQGTLELRVKQVAVFDTSTVLGLKAGV